jgi:signal transduction histidine kinase
MNPPMLEIAGPAPGTGSTSCRRRRRSSRRHARTACSRRSPCRCWSRTRHGLRAALESLTDHLPLEVALDVEARRLPVPVETAAYFVVAEALTNVVKHAGVDSAVVRAVLGENGAMQLEISDEGRGGADARGGTGLRGLADRVEAGGGSLEVDSPPGGGTRIRASIPVPPV